MLTWDGARAVDCGRNANKRIDRIITVNKTFFIMNTILKKQIGNLLTYAGIGGQGGIMSSSLLMIVIAKLDITENKSTVNNISITSAKVV